MRNNNNILARALSRIRIWLTIRIANRKMITEIFRSYNRMDTLGIATKEVRVKKGKRRYTLLIAKDGNNETVFNLGRHLEIEPSLSDKQIRFI